MLKKIFLLLFLTLLFTPHLTAQSFGFGCLGLSGFYAGITHQYYETPGLSEYLNRPSAILDYSTPVKFERGTGYRVGANLFRLRSGGVFITAKGYYQFLKETKERTASLTNLKQKTELSMNYWGAGLDLGVAIFSLLDWKIVEGNITFNNSEFTEEYASLNGELINEIKYSPENVKLGYFIGSGIIFHLIPDYVSVEATAGYNFIDIQNMADDQGNTIPVNTSEERFINKNGFSATVQLNVGFPL
jgi:hypothetical protein